MNNKTKAILYSAALSACSISSAEASLSSTAVLNFDSPVYNTDGQVIAGSNFAVDFTGDGAIDITERTGLTMNNGLVLGSTQLATPTTPGIDQPWSFFENLGVHQTTSPVTIISDDGAGNIELDFSGWSVNWNGVDIGLGGDSWGSNPDGVAQMTCANDCSTGDAFTIFYTATAHQPGLEGIRYRLGFDSNALLSTSLALAVVIEDPGLITTGIIGASAVPIPAAFWLFGSGLIGLLGIARRRQRN